MLVASQLFVSLTLPHPQIPRARPVTVQPTPPTNGNLAIYSRQTGPVRPKASALPAHPGAMSRSVGSGRILRTRGRIGSGGSDSSGRDSRVQGWRREEEGGSPAR